MLRRSLFAIFYIALLTTLVGGGCASIAPDAPRVQISALPPEEPLPIPLVVISGDPQSIGEQHGSQLHDQIQTLEEKYLNVRLADTKQKLMALAATSMFDSYITPEQHQEIVAMAQASGMDSHMAQLAQCFLDLTDTVACSTVALPASASPDGVPRLARNLDFPSMNVLDKMSAVIVYRPTGCYSFAAINWPGFLGVVSGMNERGLTLCNMEVPRAPRLPQAMPYPLLYRTVLEKCATVDEAIGMLKSMPRQSANNLMLMDAGGNRALAEIKPESVTVRRADPNHALISTNHQRGDDESTPGMCWRYDRIHETTERSFGSLGVDPLKQLLASVQQGKNGSFTIQSMIFEPSTRTIYLATGAGAANQKFYRIDLEGRFNTPSAATAIH